MSKRRSGVRSIRIQLKKATPDKEGRRGRGFTTFLRKEGVRTSLSNPEENLTPYLIRRKREERGKKSFVTYEKKVEAHPQNEEKPRRSGP